MRSSSNPHHAGSLPRPPIHPPFPVSHTLPAAQRVLHTLAAGIVVVLFGGMFFICTLYIVSRWQALDEARARFDLDYERGAYVVPALREIRR